MRRFLPLLLLVALSLAIVGGFAGAASPTQLNGKADKDAVPIAGARAIGRFTIGIASNLALTSTTAGPRIVGLAGIFSPSPAWAVWDGTTGTLLARLPNKRGSLTADACTPALSPDGTRLALIYRWQISQFNKPTDQVETVVYDVKKRTAVFTDRRRGPVNAVAYTPQGTLLVFAADTCHVLEPGKNQLTRKFKLAAPAGGAIAVSPDGSRLALYARGALQVYDLGQGKLEFELATDSKPKKEDNQKLPPGIGNAFPGAMSFGPMGAENAMLVFSNSADAPKLLIYETLPLAIPNGASLEAAVANLGSLQGQLRLVDINKKKEVDGRKLAKGVAGVQPYFTADGSPRALTSAPVPEPAKEPAKPRPPIKQPFPPKGPAPLDTRIALNPAQTVQFAVIDLSGKALHEFTLRNPPTAIPMAPLCLLTADGRYLLALTTSSQQQQKAQSTATVWDLKAAK